MCEIANRTKVVAIASQTGGSGKTSITISTAVHAQKAGFRIPIVDIDPQGSAALWENLRRRSGNQNPPHVTQCAARHLEGAIAVLKRGGFDVVYVVTPGINSPDVDMALRVADLCVAPCESAVFDLQATRIIFERVGVSARKPYSHTRLFRDWKWRVRSDGKVLHGDALTRDWQRRKADVTTCANVCAYSGRHSMASLLDALEMPQRDRDRVMGHSHPGVSGRYGRKGALPAKLVKAFLERDDPTLNWMRTHLVAARDRAEKDRNILEPWVIRPLDKPSSGR